MKSALRKGAVASGDPVRLSGIVERDGQSCRLCGCDVDLTLRYPHPMSKSLDHVVPLSRGGAHTIENVQLAHLRCNMSKGARLVA